MAGNDRCKTSEAKKTIKRSLRRDRRGAIYVYFVLVGILIIGVGFGFMFMQLTSTLQGAINPMLAEGNWLSSNMYTQFYYAATLLTNIWTYIIGFVILVAIYWSYTYSQRRSAGY